ncbi:type II toxin-antitoxin system prevent-host-death family antitoxin [Nonomuraea sp. 3-1Str]|uniref:type II toxin-antitoxin system Phd/YefM family antitoxin n=1 Tax=Nonomuraea sp. 3-1Str TaxID=2929801 RepID=UPI0028580430|nr:type II toxin-antitoxin system prevent-host-death family antitoxin [Nonomuraea sp. 3-1Str]MDR8408977.1 type II toxin-antitoxin system prevent-host-death family antitoxin [Nonomuraea sp. 3-1Str]
MSGAWHEPPEINQRDLKNRTGEIMDAIERGKSFTLTRHGHQIATVIPISRRRTFVPKERFLAVFENAPIIDDEEFEADVRAAFHDAGEDPWERAERIPE